MNSAFHDARQCLQAFRQFRLSTIKRSRKGDAKRRISYIYEIPGVPSPYVRFASVTIEIGKFGQVWTSLNFKSNFKLSETCKFGKFDFKSNLET